MSVHPTPFPEINPLLDELLSRAQAVLGSNFVGLYLYGSLASGDFDPERSDIDFVIVTRNAVSNEQISTLEAMHIGLANSGLKWAKKLEGSYIPQADLRRYERTETEYPTLNEGKFYLGRHSSDWIIQRHILREHGVVLAGVPPRNLIDPVEPEDLRRAVIGVLNDWWTPMLENPAWLRSDEYQAYAVLTMCRALFTLEHGSIASKPVSARWAQEKLDERYAALIERALLWQHGEQFNRLDETLDFIRYTLENACQRRARL